MTHQNHQTNGASLEDCHTNFFALTELYGIKWRKLVWGETRGGGEGEEGATPLADPVISSYARCLAGDILCVWRRVPAPQPPDIYEMSAPAPPPLSLRAAKELWIFWYGEEPDLNGLVAPELIASQGDQGSWDSGLSYECRSLLFKALHNLIERCLLSRDFVRLGKWFVQPYDGDEEDVGKSPWHLSFSFAFFLHGESTVCASVDVRQHPPVRTLTARRRHALHGAGRRADAKVILAPFGLEGTLTGREWTDNDPATARLLEAWRQLYPLEQGCGAVEVVCGGVRMRYPLPYALVTEMESAPAPPPSAAALARRTMHALAAPSPHLLQAESCCNESSGEKPEDFVDPTRKTPCTCAKWRRRRGPRPPPFHRRAPARAPRRAAPPPAPASASASASATAAAPAPPRAALTAGCGGGAAGGSPGSCGGGSPAAAVSAPSSAGAPPASPHHTALPSQSGGGGPGVPPSLHTPAPTPDPLAPPTPAPPSAPAKHYAQGDSPPGGGPAAAESVPAELLRRPQLPPAERRADPLEDEHSLHMLYDYTTVLAWLEHPVKRFKSEESTFREELALGAAAGGDLYAGHDHTSMPATTDHAPLDVKQEKHDPEDVKEYKNLFTLDGLHPTLRDLDQIFENSDDAASGDETVRLLAVQTPPDSNKSAEEARYAGRCVRAEELSKMFPTPPSMEAHTQPSPGFTLPDDAPPPHLHALHALHAHAPAAPGAPAARLATPGSPPPDPIEDWSYVFKPPTMYKCVGSSKYAPLPTLPSQQLPPVALPPDAVYRPRWQLEPPKRPRPPDRADRADGADTPDTHRTGVKRSASPAAESREARGRRACSNAPAQNGGGAPAAAGAVAGAGAGSGPGAAAGAAAAQSPASAAHSPASPASPRATGAACPLLLNVLLADTVLNVFRDHNFDSCTLCVCNAGPRVVGNIRGADAATYLSGAGAGAGADESPGGSPAAAPAPADDEPSRCTCGFSAIVNRRLAHRAGLFYEDEMEITGLAEEPRVAAGGRGGLAEVAGVVVAQCAALAGGGASALARAARRHAAPASPDELRLNLLEYSDGGTAASRALRAAGGGSGGGAGAVHRWPFIGARAPRSSRDVVRLMRRLRPLLQDAIQKRCCGARMWDGVTGPLTWRQFHRLAGRGNEDLCEPQPVPPLLVGHDRDWISLSPYALRHWERLALEPYSYARDVAYVVLAADGDVLTDPLRTFFRELSAAYEALRLGRHHPVHRIARDGIVRAGCERERDTSDAECEEWAGELPPGRLGEYVRAYADALRTSLVPALAALTVDRSLFESDRSSPMRPPATPEHPGTPGADGDETGAGGGANASAANGGGASTTGGAASAWDDDENGAPALVLYLVEPPAAHAQRPRALHALLRLATRIHHHLRHHNPLIKIISLEGVYETWAPGPSPGPGAAVGGGCVPELRALAFSVFSGARRLLVHAANGKTLTGFGTAAVANHFINNKDEKNKAPYKLFSPAWVLAPPRALKEVAETWGQACGEQGAVLFVAYCLSHDQRWLLAAASDARGELRDTAAINIHVPARSRRRRCGPARRLGLKKLMDFTLGVMSQAAQPWRLVVGRVGRIGHGELKGWSWLLSRKHLWRASMSLRELCGSCAALYPAAPCILSACLVSTEPDSCLRLMADRFTPDERFSQASIHSHLHTPRDVTATHILVFPTSATTQSNQMPFEPQMANGEDNDMMFLNVDMGDEDMGEDNMADLLIGDMFSNMWAQNSPRNSPRRNDDDPASPACPPHHVAACHHQDDLSTEQVGTVLQQPLALGYMVSTAPLGAMPAWWWAGCTHLRDACPAFLKNALHLHTGNVQAADDFTSLTQRRDHNSHPLDSQTTTDVLRYVLEGYNALSWLALDGASDRLSCLPVHVQALMQLYHTAAALG
ncbi:mediator of RNA polymerase II transcription subunit 13 isoform X2 [Galleria mellonella]|uniref:Mediator of RNA polymerase II transcription subunit 13 n=1 Tax=Galleria mellonella TaxID=7137 RepID=A0ABM3N1X9_GALME|nr:mediator of RNA polymerase II transcription subunit 13 isoform X2 [Galleria mellonella]